MKNISTRKRLIAAAAILLAALFFLAPPAIDGMINSVSKTQWKKPSPRAARLHATLDAADLHADSLMGGRDLLGGGSNGHVDVSRLIRGRVALQVFGIVTSGSFSSNIKSNAPPMLDVVTVMALAERWPPSTWRSRRARVLHQSSRMRKIAARSDGKLTLILSRADLAAYLSKRKQNPNMAAALLAVEGAHALDGDLSALDDFYKAGVRMMSPTHFFDNDIAGSMQGVKKTGLTPLGRDMVRRMEKKRIIIDLAHSSERTIDDVLKMATRPTVVSHTGVKGTCDNNRNLADRQIREIAKRGGLIGIMYWETALCGLGPDAIARAIRHTANVAGAEHVALGSDFDGSIEAPFDTSNLVYITDALIRQGFTDSEIAGIMGGNTLSFLAKNLP